MNVHIISKESIKPSSPTPIHLKTFKLSLLDQLIPAPYAPIVLFYPNYDCATRLQVIERSKLLKKSLSETLTRFYPLAGIIKDDLSIDCNDEGAYYVVARVSFSLSQFLNCSELMQSINQLLPCELNLNASSDVHRVTNIQINIFECGGIGIGLCISHKILDGAALSTFLKGWASTASASEKVVYPNFMGPSLFPTNELLVRDASMVMWGSLFKKGKGVTKRFVLNSLGISILKTDVQTSCTKHPTRVEAVSAFLWKRAMVALEEKRGFKRQSLMTHVVNLRPRSVPAMPQNCIGNLIWISSAKCIWVHDHEVALSELVGEVRESIGKIDGDYVKRLRGDNGCDVMCKSLKKIGEFGSKEEVDYFGFTSWCKIGFYDVDFGWGKPIWMSSVGSSGPMFMNLIILMDTKCGNGIEAWVTLDEQEMSILERDPELQKLACLDPSPLKIGNYDLEPLIY